MNLHAKFIQNIDEKSLEFVQLLETKSAIVERTGEMFGSIAAKRTVDLTDKIVETSPITQARVDTKGNKFETWIQKDENLIGFGKENYQKFKAFVKSIHGNREIKRLVHESFVEKEIFQWLYGFSDQEEPKEILSTTLVRRIKESIEFRTYCFPVSNLIIHQPFDIGDVTIKFLTSEDLKNIDSKIAAMYEGAVVASVDINAEPSLGQEIALGKCSLAIDLLKIYSKTLFNPETVIDFDIDVRTQIIDQASIISHPVGEISPIHIKWYAVPSKYYLQPADFQMMNEMYIVDIIKLINSDNTGNELSIMLINAIRNFANAISVKNLHKRIADLFSVYESLLVPNKSAHILESLKKYGPKLITPEIEERKEIKKRFTALYDVRSALIHHRQHENFELYELSRLQFHLLVLILNLTRWNAEYYTKIDVLNKIDDTIEQVQISL